MCLLGLWNLHTFFLTPSTRLLANTTIEMIPPSLVQARSLAARRTHSVGSLRQTNQQGGIKAGPTLHYILLIINLYQVDMNIDSLTV